MRQRVTELEAADTELKRVEEALQEIFEANCWRVNICHCVGRH